MRVCTTPSVLFLLLLIRLPFLLLFSLSSTLSLRVARTPFTTTTIAAGGVNGRTWRIPLFLLPLSFHSTAFVIIVIIAITIVVVFFIRSFRSLVRSTTPLSLLTSSPTLTSVRCRKRIIVVLVKTVGGERETDKLDYPRRGIADQQYRGELSARSYGGCRRRDGLVSEVVEKKGTG